MKKSFISLVAKTALFASVATASMADMGYVDSSGFTGGDGGPRHAVVSKNPDGTTKAVVSVVPSKNPDSVDTAVAQGTEKCVLTKQEGHNSNCFVEDIVEPEPIVVPVVKKPAPPKQKVLSKYQRSYIVFFDFDKSFLTEDAKDVLDNLRQAVSGTKNNVYQLVGHTDSSGSNKYNVKLSQRRALTVKKKMVEMGIPADKISTTWKGESSLLVPTKDGIKEPQNRRVEIQVQYYK